LYGKNPGSAVVATALKSFATKLGLAATKTAGTAATASKGAAGAVATEAVTSEADIFNVIPDPLAEATAEAASSGNAAWTTGDDLNIARATLLNTSAAVVGVGGLTGAVMVAEAMVVNSENNSNVPEGGKKTSTVEAMLKAAGKS
jgi:hypothetical protein